MSDEFSGIGTGFLAAPPKLLVYSNDDDPRLLVELVFATGHVTLHGDPNEAAKVFWGYVQNLAQRSANELTELRALRDRLVKPLIRDGLENYGRIADTSGEDDMEFEGELFRIIARAQELAD